MAAQRTNQAERLFGMFKDHAADPPVRGGGAPNANAPTLDDEHRVTDTHIVAAAKALFC